MIHAAEKGGFAPEKLCRIAGIVFNFVVPQLFGKRLIKAVEKLDDIAQRMPDQRIVVVDKHRLAARLQAVERVIDDPRAGGRRHFVQQHIADDDVIFALGRLGSVAVDKAHKRIKITVFVALMTQLHHADVQQVIMAVNADFGRRHPDLVAESRPHLQNVGRNGNFSGTGPQHF